MNAWICAPPTCDHDPANAILNWNCNNCNVCNVCNLIQAYCFRFYFLLVTVIIFAEMVYLVSIREKMMPNSWNLRRELRVVLLEQVGFQKRFLKVLISFPAIQNRGWTFLWDSEWSRVDWERLDALALLAVSRS